MLRLIGLAVSIGLADSLNPTTIAPALYLASGKRPRRRVLEFTAAVFAVSLAAGLIISLGPGQLVLSALPRLGTQTRGIVEIVIGALMVAVAPLVWIRHRNLPPPSPGKFDLNQRSGAFLGATITAIELPTAFPYLAIIATAVAADAEPMGQVVVLVMFNLCFVAPLLTILLVLSFGGDRANSLMRAARRKLADVSSRVFAALLLSAGLLIALLGVAALES